DAPCPDLYIEPASRRAGETRDRGRRSEKISDQESECDEDVALRVENIALKRNRARPDDDSIQGISLRPPSVKRIADGPARRNSFRIARCPSGEEISEAANV